MMSRARLLSVATVVGYLIHTRENVKAGAAWGGTHFGHDAMLIIAKRHSKAESSLRTRAHHICVRSVSRKVHNLAYGPSVVICAQPTYEGQSEGFVRGRVTMQVGEELRGGEMLPPDSSDAADAAAPGTLARGRGRTCLRAAPRP